MQCRRAGHYSEIPAGPTCGALDWTVRSTLSSASLLRDGGHEHGFSCLSAHSSPGRVTICRLRYPFGPAHAHIHAIQYNTIRYRHFRLTKKKSVSRMAGSVISKSKLVMSEVGCKSKRGARGREKKRNPPPTPPYHHPDISAKISHFLPTFRPGQGRASFHNLLISVRCSEVQSWAVQHCRYLDRCMYCVSRPWLLS